MEETGRIKQPTTKQSAAISRGLFCFEDVQLSLEIRSEITSEAIIRPATDGTYAVEPGILRFPCGRASSGGLSGVLGDSVE